MSETKTKRERRAALALRAMVACMTACTLFSVGSGAAYDAGIRGLHGGLIAPAILAGLGTVAFAIVWATLKFGDDPKGRE